MRFSRLRLSMSPTRASKSPPASAVASLTQTSRVVSALEDSPSDTERFRAMRRNSSSVGLAKKNVVSASRKRKPAATISATTAHTKNCKELTPNTSADPSPKEMPTWTASLPAENTARADMLPVRTVSASSTHVSISKSIIPQRTSASRGMAATSSPTAASISTAANAMSATL